MNPVAARTRSFLSQRAEEEQRKGAVEAVSERVRKGQVGG